MKHIHCPINDLDCPYLAYDEANGYCLLYPEFDPLIECDDFAVFWDEGDDYICEEEHE